LRPSNSRLRHRIAAAATTLTLTGGLIAAGAASAQALPWAPGARGTSAGSAGAGSASAGPSFAWARTVTGREVRVPKLTFISTPVHPEKLTHPGRDYMGSTIRAHEHWSGHAIRRDSVFSPDASISSGIDISAYQGDINWGSVCPHVGFVYAKATEGTYYTNPDFSNQYEGPYSCGVIRGAYHFAIPSNSQAWIQAKYFVAHGGGWSSDGKTLPGALDIEYNPYGQECYNLTQSQMVDWIKGFVDSYASRAGVYPVIYTTTDWWKTCTGNHKWYFGSRDPLWIANYSASKGGPMPAAWGWYTFWQYADSGSLPGDQNVFNGSYSRVQVLAKKG
jgi:GH25 family lysozyme M1 (1,4-beta-N-acetylmuramidase)